MLALMSGWSSHLPCVIFLALTCFSGAVVSSFDLVPILFKRLRIQGSTLRSRSPEYQAKLIEGFRTTVADKLTGEDGDGPLTIFIHAVSLE